MKSKSIKKILLIVCLVLFLMNTSCQKSETSVSENETSVQMSTTSYFVHDEKTYSISEDDASFVADLINNAECKNGIYKSHFDFLFVIDGEEWSYSSGHGVFSHLKNEKRFKPSDEENDRIQQIIDFAGIVIA